MTGERLREFSESKTVYTNYLGDDIFEVVYWEGDDGQQDVDSDKILGQLMSRDEAIGYLKSADVLGIKIVSARRSNIELEDNKPLYEVRWIDLHPDLEVSPEELNTGPDTTENINEVHESYFMSYRSLRDFISAHPGIQVIDRIEAGNLVKITYKIPTEMESKDEKPVLYDPRTYCRVTEEDQDPESERINKAVERMKWRNRNNFRDVDATEAPGRGTLEKVVDEARKRGCTYTGTPESDEKIRKAMSGWSKERNTDSPGAKQAEEALRNLQEKWKSMDRGDVVFGVDQGPHGNVDPLMSREYLEKYREPIVLGPNPVITPGAETIDDLMEEERLNLECGKYYDPRDFENGGKGSPKPLGVIMKSSSFTPGSDVDKETEQRNKNVSHPADYYQYGRILERMDDTHRRKNSDYGDAAYKGYKKFGDYYFMVQLHNKYQRLESLTIGNKSQQVNEESIDDTLLDMANYAVMYLESRHRND